MTVDDGIASGYVRWMSVEVLGRSDATLVADELRRLDADRLLLVSVKSAPARSQSAVALRIAAPSGSASLDEIELSRHADVVFGGDEDLRDQTARLWSERLALYVDALRDDRPMSSPPVLHEFDSRWSAAGGRRLRRLRAAFAAVGAVRGSRFEHIGSTSVRGLCAKPILDLQVRVPQLRHDEDFDAALHRVGFAPTTGSGPDSPGIYRDTPRGSEPVTEDVWEKRLFVSPDPAEPAILHVRQLASPWGRLTVQFRDWLRALIRPRSPGTKL